MMVQLAFYTFGILREPQGHPQVQGFFDRVTATFESAEGTDGFVNRQRGGRPAELGPRFFVPGRHARAPQTISVWRDLESVFAFAYRGVHGVGLRHRKAWFLEPAWPTYVAWWVEDDYLPSWEEGIEHLEYLHDHGPTPRAFTFRHPFDAEGRPIALDPQQVHAKAATVR
jgi:hypothetical protein